MTIDDLRTIGRRVLDMVPRYRFAPDSRVALQVGAGGDKTFPMDKKAEEIILSSLEALGEPLSIISEEFGTHEIRGGGITVIVDPIDGSKNAISGLPVFCTSLALSSGERIRDIFMSYVLNLISGDEFWAEKGKGAFLNGRRIRTQQEHDLSIILYEAQSPVRDIPKIVPALSLFHRARCLGATALDLAYLSLGSASAFIAPAPSRSFDFAGGWLLAREAGGIVTDLSGKSIEDITLGLGYSAPIMASGNQSIHEILIRTFEEAR